MERVMGIEPTYQAWEARVLPLNYTRTVTVYSRLQEVGKLSTGGVIRERSFATGQNDTEADRVETCLGRHGPAGGCLKFIR